MDNDQQDQLLASFVEAAGKQMSDVDEIQNLAAQIVPSGEDAQGGGGAGDGNLYGDSATSAGSSVHGGSTTQSGGSGGNGGASFGSIATTFLEGGLGVVPLVTGLIGLFGGGSKAAPVFEKYQMPSPISFTSADTGGGLSAADFDQMGSPRAYSNDSTTSTPGSGGAGSSSAGTGGAAFGGGTNSASPQISVQVQTMDARSFLDNSDQIAQAVRGAMLNLSSINDVVNDL